VKARKCQSPRGCPVTFLDTLPSGVFDLAKRNAQPCRSRLGKMSWAQPDHRAGDLSG